MLIKKIYHTTHWNLYRVCLIWTRLYQKKTYKESKIRTEEIILIWGVVLSRAVILLQSVYSKPFLTRRFVRFRWTHFREARGRECRCLLSPPLFFQYFCELGSSHPETSVAKSWLPVFTKCGWSRCVGQCVGVSSGQIWEIILIYTNSTHIVAYTVKSIPWNLLIFAYSVTVEKPRQRVLRP